MRVKVVVQDIVSNTAFQIAVPIVIAGLIGVGALVGLVTSWLAIIVGLLIVLWVALQQIRAPRWRFRTTPLSTDPDNALAVTLQNEEWDVYQHTAWILKIKVKIRNRTPAIQGIDGWELRGSGGLNSIVPGLSQEIERRKQDHPEPQRAIPPGRAVEGWLFYRFAFAPVGGVPTYDLLLHSKTGQQYGFHRTNRPPIPIPRAS